jgi:hypothetical protein
MLEEAPEIHSGMDTNLKEKAIGCVFNVVSHQFEH